MECPQCGKEFILTRPSRRWCSKDCKYAASREARRDKIHAAQKAYRDSPEGRAYHLAYTAKYMQNPKNRFRVLIRNARKRAAKAGIPFDEKLLASIVASSPTHCVCCGCSLDYTIGRGRALRGGRSRSPSLDRFDTTGGYTVENVNVICLRCNIVKGNATREELRAVAEYASGVKRWIGPSMNPESPHEPSGA